MGLPVSILRQALVALKISAIALAILILFGTAKLPQQRKLLRVVHPLTGEFLMATYDRADGVQARERVLFAECEKQAAYAEELEIRLAAQRIPLPTPEETAKFIYEEQRREAEARAKAMNEELRSRGLFCHLHPQLLALPRPVLGVSLSTTHTQVCRTWQTTQAPSGGAGQGGPGHARI